MDGNRLKKMRIDKGISLTKLSEQTGISKSYLSLIERDIQRNPSLDILGKLSKTLEVDMDDLVKQEREDQDWKKKKPPIKSTIKLEIELTEEQLCPRKMMQLKELIKLLETD